MNAINVKGISMNAHKELLHCLINIRAGDRKPYVGICRHIQDDQQQYVFNGLCKEWPKYSGDKEYPVPSVDPDDTPRDAYNASGDEVYEGEYGALRLELVDYCIDRLENGYEI